MDYIEKALGRLKKSCLKKENMIDIAALRGRDLFYKRSYGQESLPDIANSCNFFKHIGIDPLLLEGAKALSFREKQVLVACSDVAKTCWLEWQIYSHHLSIFGVLEMGVESPDYIPSRRSINVSTSFSTPGVKQYFWLY